MWSAAFAFLSLPLLLCARLAALDHEAVLIVSAVGVNESGLIVGVEEILLAQSLDLVVDGIQQRLIALADGGGNCVLAAQGRDADSVAGVLAGKRDDLGVVVGPCSAIAVFQRVLGGRLGIILLSGGVWVLHV